MVSGIDIIDVPSNHDHPPNQFYPFQCYIMVDHSTYTF